MVMNMITDYEQHNKWTLLLYFKRTEGLIQGLCYHFSFKSTSFRIFFFLHFTLVTGQRQPQQSPPFSEQVLLQIKCKTCCYAHAMTSLATSLTRAVLRVLLVLRVEVVERVRHYVLGVHCLLEI